MIPERDKLYGQLADNNTAIGKLYQQLSTAERELKDYTDKALRASITHDQIRHEILEQLSLGRQIMNSIMDLEYKQEADADE